MKFLRKNLILVIVALILISALGVGYYLLKRQRTSNLAPSSKVMVDQETDKEVKELDTLIEEVKEEDFAPQNLSDEEVGF